MMQITRKDLIRYAVFPGLKSRMADLFASGFHYIPYFIALVYQCVRLLPANHPYVNPANIGRFGIRHVIGEAANNLVVSGKNIDQLLLFITIMAGMVILLIQLVLLFISFAFQPVMAAMPTNFAGFFLTPTASESQDLALMMLDMVFGVPGMFNSCVSTAVPCLDAEGNPIVSLVGGTSIFAFTAFPYPIHVAMHQLFQFYSIGLLIVAVFIASYFIIAVVAETAQTGTAFGKRFNKVWAPLRIVAAFGLLIPVGFGLNSSQYIVLYAAKFGSGFATNGWNLFNSVLTTSYLGDVQNLVSTPNVPEVGGLLQFYYTARTCYEAEKMKSDAEVKPYLVGGPLNVPPSVELTNNTFPYHDYDFLVNFADGATSIKLRFGIYDDPNTDNDLDTTGNRGYVEPTCGEVTMQLTDPRPPGQAEPGTEILQRYYWLIVQELWWMYEAEPPVNYPLYTVQRFTNWQPDPLAPLPDNQFRTAQQDFYTRDLQAALSNPGASPGLSGAIGGTGAVPAQVASGRWSVPPQLLQKGWGGAGIWYNRVAEMNGAVTSAAFKIPLPTSYPKVMEHVRQRKRQYDQDTTIDQRYNPILANGQNVLYDRPQDAQMAVALWQAFHYWQADGHVTTSHTSSTGNIIIDVINALLGTEGLYSMRRNPDVHPLAQLVGVGRSLVEAAIRNLMLATGSGVGGAVFSSIDNFFGNLGGIAAGFLITFAMISLTVGFVLFYVVPFLPFIYFFFAVGGWVKGIFEAMVGAPLWALAHIRIDGEGLPGQAAVNGYFLIFEIFLRPILIVFGLLASISIFAALVSVLNEIFDLVTGNLTGFDVRAETEGIGPGQIEFYRGPVDEFFFTIIYAIIVYLMGMSSFKLIDLIPNNILRWMGQSVATFGDQREDPAQGLTGKATIGAQQALGSIGGGLQGLAGIPRGMGSQ